LETGVSRLTRKLLLGFLLLLWLSLGLSGCVSLTDWEVSQDFQRDVAARLQPGQPAGQSFTARRSGLNSIQVFTGTNEAAPGTPVNLRADLFYSLEDIEPVFSKNITLHDQGPVVIDFPPRPDPPGQTYFLLLQIEQGSIPLYGRSENTYPEGQAFSGFIPQDADLAFRTTYHYGLQAFLQDFKAGISGTWLLLPLAVLLLAPGWLILDFSGLRKRFDGGEQAALSIGLSLSILPLLMLWTSIIDARWTQFSTTAAGILLVGAVLFQVLRRPLKITLTWQGAALLLVFIVSFGLRLVMVRDLAAPAWVDSVHHSLISRLIQENGAFPSSYNPFINLDATQYHAGFHTGLAAFSWLSRMEPAAALLLYGQVLNAAVVLAAYLLTTTLTRDRWAGVIAALFTGLITPMPAYYLSWGRYTHLAGLLILPAAPALVRLFFDRVGASPRAVLLLAVLAFSGLILVHYRVAAFLGLLLIAMVISRLKINRESFQNLARQTGLAAGAMGGGALLLSGPWLLPTLNRHILPALTPSQVTPAEPFTDFSWGLLTAGFGIYSLWLAGLGLLLGLVLRQRFALAAVLWVGLLFLLANLGALGLPGGWFVNNPSVQISLFLPISLLAGYLLSVIIRTTPSFLPQPLLLALRGLIVGGLLVFGFLGMRQLMTITNPNTILVRDGDLAAMQWIREFIPPEETILISPFSWGYGVYAGSDGGFWISPLTGRKTMPPPVLYGMGNPEQVRAISSLSRQAVEHGSSPMELNDLMQAHGLRYVFIGVRGGAFSSNALFESPLFNLVYSNHGVSLFQAVESALNDEDQ
jgi:hypothetical protein